MSPRHILAALATLILPAQALAADRAEKDTAEERWLTLAEQVEALA